VSVDLQAAWRWRLLYNYTR